MDKETLSNYGWIVICVLVLAVMIALATPFGSFIRVGVENTAQGLFSKNQMALEGVGIGVENSGIGVVSLTHIENFEKGSTENAVYKANVASSDFVELKIDDATVDPANYAVSGTVATVTVNSEYMNMLSLGSHKLAIVANVSSQQQEIAGLFDVVSNALNPDDGTTPQDWDTYETDDYIYTYRVYLAMPDMGWNVVVKDTGKTSYEPILESINGVPVTSMDGTFNTCVNMTSAPIVPSGVTIMSGTFSGCEALETTPIIPEGARNLTRTFQNCKLLTTTPVIPEGVTDLKQTFAGCSSLTQVATLPSSLNNLEQAFEWCSSLVNAPVIPDGVTNMKGAFYSCQSLITAPQIPDEVTNMVETFRGCVSMKGIQSLPNKITSLLSTFSGCTQLETVVAIPDTVTSMNSTFLDCSSLKETPSMPGGVTSMTYTYYGCTSLTTVTALPGSVRNLTAAFGKCISLTTKPTIPSDCLTTPDVIFQGCPQFGYPV